MNLKPLTIAGLVGTVAWAGFVAWYLDQSGQMKAVLTATPNNFGDFWAGTFAPLAFWWLVLGYFQQGIELRQNVEALEQQSKETANLVVQAKVQAEAIKANELHARRDIFLRYADLMVADMQFKSLLLIMAAKNSGWGTKFKAVIQKSHDAYFAGDKDAPVRRLVEIMQSAQDEFRTGAMINRDVSKLIERLLDDYRSILTEANVADGGDRSLVGFYEHSLYGDLYAAICFICMQDTGFSVRPRITGLDEILI